MEDRRVRKTKKNLKGTLIEMLADMPFEQISITELCRRADTSRITFYSHYSDKYALADDIFQDMIRIGTGNYIRRQAENNPGRDLVLGYCNVLDVILELYYANYDFFRHTLPEENPYLAFSFYNYVLETVEMHTDKEARILNFHLRYTAKKIAGFLCYGILGFINECHSEKETLEEIRGEAKEILKGLLRSDVLVSRETSPAPPPA